MAQYKGASSEGGRSESLLKQRENERIDFENKKKEIEELNSMRDIGNKFQSVVEDVSTALSKQTVGLFKLEDFRKRRENLEKMAEMNDDEKEKEQLELARKRKKAKQKQKSKKIVLSFGADDEEEEEEKIAFVVKTKKNPTVETDFLPDRERQEKEEALKDKLRREWVKKQEIIKEEPISITYSYWDGSGHRRDVKVKKGDSIRQFLQKSLTALRSDFYDLRNIGVEQLMYIKEDLIIPHHYTFYDFILNKSRGKSGPLFKFDVHDDIRLVNDATVEKDESHAGKVVQRTWYERNKHMFPASRWEMFNPDKKYGKYTISDKEREKKEKAAQKEKAGP